MKSTIIKIVLLSIVICLAYFGLYDNITNEIYVRERMDERKAENIQKLKDLREIQLEYKRQKGQYADNADSLIYFLFNTEVTYINTEKADEDSIAVDMNKWNSIQNKISRGKINPSVEAKRIYTEMGGNWKTLTEKEKIDKGYIEVNYYIAHELAFTTDYKETRNNSFKIDTQNLANIKRSYNNQKSYISFKSGYNTYSDEVIRKLEINNIYEDLHANFNAILDLDTNTNISTKNLQSKVSDNKKELEILKSQILDKEDSKENAKNIIRSSKKQRNTYTETIGEKMVVKVREKAAKKDEKGKVLKGRKGKIWSILKSQDSTEQVNKVIVEDCKNIILKLENEIEARKKIIKSLMRNIQSIHDLNAMQNQYINERSVVNTNFDDLAFYTLNEEIKIVTTLRKGRYTVPTKPNKWKQAQLEADFLVEQSIDEEMIAQITKEYIISGGEYRDLTTEEGYARGLITTVTQNVENIIFDNIYMETRNEDIPLNLDSIIYIPQTDNLYTFDAKETHPNIIEEQKGELDKYYFEIYASYDNVFLGLDEEEKILRNVEERKNKKIQIGSLEEVATNGNWGE
tara:strand:+ start:717 stop:2435 length:1719 start_codon:yes stop_codon:yes gene_type:complete